MILPFPALRKSKLSEVKSFKNEEMVGALSTLEWRLSRVFSQLSVTVFPLITTTMTWVNSFLYEGKGFST